MCNTYYICFFPIFWQLLRSREVWDIVRKRRGEIFKKRRGINFLVGGDKRRSRFTVFGMMRRDTALPFSPCFCGKSWSAYKEHLEDCAWSACWNDFEKSEREDFFFKKTNLQDGWLKREKRWQNLWWYSIYSRLSIHFKVRRI